MEDLIQCFATKNDFQQWLNLGNGPMTVYKGTQPSAMLIKVDKIPNVNYLYRTAVDKNNSVSWSNSLMFCGVYNITDWTLYLTEDSLHSFMDDQNPMVTKTIPSTVKQMRSRINHCVENIIANDRNNLPTQEITDTMNLRNLRYYQEYGAKEDAIRQFFDDKAPDGQFHSSYAMDELREANFLAYIQDPEGFIQTEAEKFIKTNQEEILLDFLENDALLSEYQALMQDTDNPVHRMKAITEAVKASGGKTMTVTVQKAEQELTFKTEASSLTGYKNYYSTYGIPASDRREFEKLFGRHADYSAEDITRITYGRNTIYESAPTHAEELADENELGGMQLGYG